MENIPTYWIFYLTLLVAAILPRVPILGKYFQVFNTLIHENGHAIVALLTMGKIRKIELFADTSGSTITMTNNRISRFLTSLAGYPASAGAAFLLYFLLKQQQEFTILISIGALIAINLLLFVRNTYGIIWLISFGGLLYFLFYMDNPLAMRTAVIFFAGILFWGSLLSPAYLIVMAWRFPKNAGDATNLNKLTGIPSFLWSVLFFVSSLWIAWFTIQLFPLTEKITEFINKVL